MALELFLKDLLPLNSLNEVAIVVDNSRITTAEHTHVLSKTRKRHSASKDEKSRCRWQDLKRQNSDSCLMAIKPSRGSPPPPSKERKCRWQNLSRQESASNLMMKPQRKSSSSQSPKYWTTKKVVSDSVLSLPRRFESPHHFSATLKNAQWNRKTMSTAPYLDIDHILPQKHNQASKLVDAALGIVGNPFASPI